MTIEHDEAPEPAPGEGRFDRFATKVGDLDSPFYDEERDVWNAHRRGVDPGNPQARRNATVRMWLFAVVMAAVASGFLRAASLLEVAPGSNVDSFLRGAAQGSGVAFIVVTALAVVFATRHALPQRGAPAE